MYWGLIKILSIALASGVMSQIQRKEISHHIKDDVVLWNDLINVDLIRRALHHSDSQVQFC